MIDPVSAFYGLKYGYKGTKAFLEWLETPDEGQESDENVRELKRAVKALVEDNHRLTQLAQEHEKQLLTLETKVISIIFAAILFNGFAAWGICAAYHH